MVDFILRMQLLNCPVWKLNQYWPKVRDTLTQPKNGILETYPTLSKVIKDLHPGGTYKSLTLLEGRLISEYEDKGNDMTC